MEQAVQVGQECRIKNLPGVQGVYRDAAEWMGAGYCEISVTNNSAYFRPGASFVAKIGDLVKPTL